MSDLFRNLTAILAVILMVLLALTDHIFAAIIIFILLFS